MHAVKGGWVGQTFALSKRNESGGRKSRLRISKKARKEMVESFIKKYQSLNSGNFPSLNLTHKEVGGSFYTIREIVREIIQENRVLGPAKSLPEEQNSDKLFKQYPLGTISSEPEASPFTLPNGSALVFDQHQDTYEEHYLISKGLLHEGFDNGNIIDAGPVVSSNKEFDEIEVAMDQVSESVDSKKSMEEVFVSRSKVTQMADVTVETFPLQPASQPTYNLDGDPNKVKGYSGTLVEKDVEKAPVDVYDTSLSDRINLSDHSSLVDDEEEENVADPLLEGKSKSVDDKAVKNMADFQLGNLNSFATKDGIAHDTQVDTDIEVKSSHNDKETAEAKVVNAADDTQTQTLNGTHANTNSSVPVTVQKVTQNDSDAQHSGNSQKESTPTLHRINIESWEGASRKPPKSETNPVVAAVKSFVASFIKFWSG